MLAVEVVWKRDETGTPALLIHRASSLHWLFAVGRSAGSTDLGFPCADWILGEALLSNKGVLRDAPQSYKTSYDLALLDIYQCHILSVKMSHMVSSGSRGRKPKE